LEVRKYDFVSGVIYTSNCKQDTAFELRNLYSELGYILDGQGTVVTLTAGARDFVFSEGLRQVLEPTLHPIRWVPVILFPGVKWPVHESDDLPLSSYDVNNALPMCLMAYKGTILYLLYPSTIEKGTQAESSVIL
jgi:hypothetical protein